MIIIYRISDCVYSKIKPYSVTKKNIFLHFIHIFKNHTIYIIADNVSDETYEFLYQNYESKKIIRTYLNNAKYFMFSLDYAIKNFNTRNSN